MEEIYETQSKSNIPSNIKRGKRCPYCDGKSALVNSQVIYGEGNDYGYMYFCEPCDAYVGCHEGTKKAFGRLANYELREYKKQAHFFFDQLWQRGMDEKGLSKYVARTSAYSWLTNALDIPRVDTHIGMFTVEQCIQVIELSKPYCKIKTYK